jgi:hypothetical protein
LLSFNDYLLRPSYVSGTVLGLRESIIKGIQGLCLLGVYDLVG